MIATPLPDHLTAIFESQMKAGQSLGSPFTALLCGTIARYGLPDSRTRSTMENWKGDPSTAADALSVRLCGGLHELVLSQKCAPLEEVYPPNHEDLSEDQLHEALVQAISDHDDHLESRLHKPPQTNEVRRSSAILAALSHITEKTGLPIQLSEVGASAGLNLHLDRFQHDINGTIFGEKDSPVRLKPDWDGPALPETSPTIVERRGCDLSPFDLGEADHRTRLLSYIWPDQADRIERLSAAMGVARSHGSLVDREDAVSWLEHRLAEPVEETAHVVYHTIAWQYLPPDAQAVGNRVLDDAGSRASHSRPLFRLGMDPDDRSPGASLRLTEWPGGKSVEIARVDFHGRWIHWQIQ